MENKQQRLYEDLIIGLNQLVLSGKADYPEACFWLSIEYWEKLKIMTKADCFSDDDMAIEFFKYTKPMFTSQIQYFTLISEALIFVPESPFEQIQYWRHEMGRLPRYLARNHYFADYYDSGATELDEKYFLPVTEDWVPSDKQFYYDADPEFCSYNDYQVRGLLAHRLYNNFVREKLKELNKIHNKE